MPTLGPSAIAGACAGLVSSIVTCPLDVVKTKLQAQSTARPVSGKSATGGSGGISGGSGSGVAAMGKSTAASASSPAGGGSGSGGGHTASSPSRASAITSTVPPHNHMEVRGERIYRGLFGTLRTIYIHDGIRGFYRGLGPTIFGYLPTWAIYFTVYDGCKEFLAKNAGNGEEDFINHIASAMMAGAASTVCTSPLWVVKTRFMLQSAKPRDPSQPPPYKHTLDAFIRIMQTEGPRGFYRGLLPSLMGVSHVAVQFPLYETFKSWARQASSSSSSSSSHGHNGSGASGGPADLPPRTILACSSSAKMIASVLTYPHEVVRTRLQMHPQAKAAAAGAVSSTSTSTSTTAATGAATMVGSVEEGRPIRSATATSTAAPATAGGSDGGRRGYSTVLTRGCNSSTLLHSQLRNTSSISSSSSSSAAAASSTSSAATLRVPSTSTRITTTTTMTITREAITVMNPLSPTPHRTNFPSISTTTTTVAAARARVVAKRGIMNSSSSSFSSSSSSSHSNSTPPPPSSHTQQQPPPQQQHKYTSLLRTIRTIFQEEGLRGFYNGMGVNLIRTVPSSALTILTYELMMQSLLNAGIGGAGAGGSGGNGGGKEGKGEEDAFSISSGGNGVE